MHVALKSQATPCCRFTGRENVIIVSPKAALSKGDRVVVKTTDGKVMAKVMQRKTNKTIELASFNSKSKALKLAVKDVDWMARIIWASQ